MSVFTDRQLAVLVGLGALGTFLLYRRGRQVAESLNPGNPDNHFNNLANSALGYDNRTNSIGSAVFDLLNPGQGDALGLDE